MSRRNAREYALQVLYSRELNPESEPIGSRLSEKDAAFAEELLSLVKAHPEMDDTIAAHLEHWSMGQLNVVDKNILRLAMAEYFYSSTKPDRKLVINEAVELAKVFGGENSYRFVNGILNSVLKDRA